MVTCDMSLKKSELILTNEETHVDIQPTVSIRAQKVNLPITF